MNPLKYAISWFLYRKFKGYARLEMLCRRYPFTHQDLIDEGYFRWKKEWYARLIRKVMSGCA